MDSLQSAKLFVGEVRNELRKSTWPTRNELVESTVVVILSVILFAVFVAVCDQVLRVVISVLAHR
jgi:preprotein translocase subunit SecE